MFDLCTIYQLNMKRDPVYKNLCEHIRVSLRYDCNVITVKYVDRFYLHAGILLGYLHNIFIIFVYYLLGIRNVFTPLFFIYSAVIKCMYMC